MHLQSFKKSRIWLTLLFAVSLQVNVQASYACDMMPDMSGQKMECCCGTSHRSPLPSDILDLEKPAHQHGDLNSVEQLCDDPHVGCCIVEISVGMNDPPDSDKTATVSTAKTQPHKLFKQLDNSALFVEVYTFEVFLQIPEDELSVSLADPFLKYRPPPLYKTTERYRI
ncbi:MAG: hypothetical protein O2971_09675 [Proteobacteria bacterium]|nr:hypothetical protein [Pseudomonadota bacterium]